MGRRKNPLLTKNRQAHKLAIKALKNKPNWGPAKGYTYLKDLNPGDKFCTEGGTIGILIRCDTNATVLITEVPQISSEDKSYYLGKRTIAANTEVKLTQDFSGWKKEEGYG